MNSSGRVEKDFCIPHFTKKQLGLILLLNNTDGDAIGVEVKASQTVLRGQFVCNAFAGAVCLAQ